MPIDDLIKSTSNPAQVLQDVVDVGLKTFLIKAEDLISGHISFVDLSRRNYAHAIVVDNKQSYFIKRPTNKKMVQTLRNEALIYRVVHELYQSSQGPPLVPKFHEFHKPSNALILEYVPGVLPLSGYPTERGRPLKWVARALGKMIARLHETTSDLSRNMNSPGEKISLYEPPVFYLLTPLLSMYCMLSPANLQLIRELQQNRPLQELLESAKQAWNASCLIHGDLKWDNVLVYPPIPNKTRGLRIADWELAGRGDPAWDVASILAGYVSGWIQDEQLVSREDSKRYRPAADVSDLCRLFLKAYLVERKLTPAESVEILRRSTAYCGMKLLWVAIEAMQESRALSKTYLAHVQVAINILDRPGEALVHLFGMPCTNWPGAWLGHSRLTDGLISQVGAIETIHSKESIVTVLA